MSPIRIALGISAILLAGAFYPHDSYNYFVLLRWAACATAVWAAVTASEEKKPAILWIFVGIAILFNPILKFTFHRSTWLVIDGATAAWFALQAIRSKHKSDKQ